MKAIERIDELSESGTQYSNRPSRVPSQSPPQPRLIEQIWTANPLGDLVTKAALSSQGSDELKLQAEKYRSGENRKVNIPLISENHRSGARDESQTALYSTSFFVPDGLHLCEKGTLHALR